MASEILRRLQGGIGMTYDNEAQWKWANEYERGGRSEMKVNDKLDKIFEMQAELDNRIISERQIEKSLDEWVIGLTLAMESEIDELRREVNWRWWKNPKELDMNAIKEEIIDLWHFLVSLSIKVGLTADEVYEVYRKKNAENHARQSGTSEKKGYSLNEK
jgi:phosphoribosyl-ATP pyrophosphohydrolase